jgi:hypothetical protein
MLKKFYSLILPLLTLGTLLLAPLGAMEVNDLAQAVDVAGKQRMFTQRMLKNYTMIGLKNRFGNPQEDLTKTMNSFHKHLHLLINFNQDPKTKESLAKVKELWLPIQKELTQTPSKQKAPHIQESLEALLKQANEATFLFAKQTGKESGEIINISGRQRMLSQRMASLYMLKVWGINDPKFQEKMSQALDLFKTSQERLLNASLNTPEITRLLKRAKKSFMFFEIMNRSNSKFIPSLIYRKSDEILKDMNTVTGLYVKEENK